MTCKRLSLLMLAFAALMSAAGCSYIKTPVIAFDDDGKFLPGEVGEGLVASPNPLIPDVPMPVGFKAVASQSTWRYDGRVREVHHVYQGQAKQGDAVAFYQASLPNFHWTLIDIQAVADATLLHYAKGPEQLVVSTTQGWGVSTVTIEIKGR